MHNCLSALNDPIWKLIVSILLFFSSLRVLDARSSAKKRPQQLVTGLELIADRGSAWGQLVSGTATIHQHPPILPLASTSSFESARNLKSSRRGALGVKGVQG